MRRAVAVAVTLMLACAAAYAADRVVHVKVRADSEHPGLEAFKAMDGNPGSIWHTLWKPPAAVTPLPHEIVFDLGGVYEISGFTYVPRPNTRNGRIKNYEAYLSGPNTTSTPLAKDIGEPVAKGAFEKPDAENVINFDAPVKGRYFRLRALSNVTGQGTWAGIGDLKLHCEGVKFVGKPWPRETSKGPKGPGSKLTGPKAADPRVVPATPQVLQQDWQEQYDETSRINARHYRFPPTQVLNNHAMKRPADKSPVDVSVRRLNALIQKLKAMPGAPDLRGAERRLAAIRGKPASPQLYKQLRAIGRKIILANPLMDFDDILFVSRGVKNDRQRGVEHKVEYDGDHFCDQYYGHNGRKGGGLFILKNWKSRNAKVVDVVRGLKVPTGTNQGMLLNDGAFISPDLSWDGKTILFAWSSAGREKWSPKTRFSIFKVGIDGRWLKRLTDARFDDFDPIWLPNGRIVFMSTRRHGFGRCHGRPVPAYTMYSMKADGSDLYPIDFHETNEFHPSVDNNGMLVYTRWDYVDRDHSAAHHMWHCFPDGRDPRSFHGNYALPLTTVEGNRFPQGIRMRPWAEFNCRAVPGSGKFIATAGPHHGQAFGSLILIDVSIPDDNKMSQVKRITPDYRFPESETGCRSWQDMAFGTAWPLSEDFYLCNYKDSVCVLDAFGNRELVCKSTNKLRLLDPIPLRPRKKPAVLACKTYQGERLTKNAPVAKISVMNVNITDDFGRLPKGVEIKQLRVVQVLPKATPKRNNPRIGRGDQSLARISLGVVPVERDGSVYFRAPVGKAIYFQLLDENGMAVQSMRSVTYVHPGEHLSCLGCHEGKDQAPQPSAAPIAMGRAPSELEPEVANHIMFGFHRNVRPILEAKCVACHKTKEKAGPTDMSYAKLDKYIFYLGHGYMNRLHGGTRTKPGKFGAMFSLMGKALLNENHQKSLKEGKFTREDFRSIVMWLDMNSNEFSAYKDIARQRKGELVWPMYDVDPENYTGTETRRAPSRLLQNEAVPPTPCAAPRPALPTYRP